MAKNLTELCHLLLEHHTGELSAVIFSTLVRRGRCTIWQLATYADAPLRKVKQGVATMLERQLLYHYTAHDKAPTYFTVNMRGVYNLARSENIITLVRERYGQGAARIVSNIQHLGLVQVGDLAKAYELDNGSKRDSGLDLPDIRANGNGVPDGDSIPSGEVLPDILTVGCFHDTMRTLLQSGILVKHGERSFIPPRDLQEEVEDTVMINDFPDGKINGSKKRPLFDQAVRKLKRKWRIDDEYSDSKDLGASGTRRSGHLLESPSKRLKTTHSPANGVSNHFSDTGLRLSNELLVRVDMARCGLALRSRRLESIAHRHFGAGPAGVYRALLIALECKINVMRSTGNHFDDDDLQDDVTLPSVPSATIAEYLEPDVDLWSSIKGHTKGSQMPKEANGKKRRFVEEPNFEDIGIKQEHHSDSEDDEPITNGSKSDNAHAKPLKTVEAHLKLLEQHSKKFCERVDPDKYSSEWRVDFSRLTKMMIEGEVDATCLAREGEVAQRVSRMLREHGHLEEKDIAKYALIHAKDLEHIMTHLQTNGLLEGQEIPKDNSRNPTKCLYLWRHDTVQAEGVLIQQTYKAMSRTLQRLKHERKRYKQVITKAERTDVQGHEEEKLHKNDLAALREWRDVEERLLNQVSRMDDVIALLRDFSTTDITMCT